MDAIQIQQSGEFFRATKPERVNFGLKLYVNTLSRIRQQYKCSDIYWYPYSQNIKDTYKDESFHENPVIEYRS